MSLHDEYARLTPYEIVFPDPERARALFGLVAQEAEERDLDLTDPHLFGMTASVASFIREVGGENAPAQAAQEYRALLFHLFHFARAGYRVDLLATPAVRYLVEGAPSREAPPAPAEAGYVQLPQHLFWTLATDDGAPQSVDGVFWTLGAGDQLFVLATLSVAGEGLGVIPLPRAPWNDRAKWIVPRMREEGADFSSDLPGGELDGLYALESAGEVFKLLVRIFAHVLQVPPEAKEPPGGEGPPAPSRLPYNLVGLDG